MKEVIIQLNWLDIILLGIAIISIFLNLYQLMDSIRLKKQLYTPVHSTLVAMFNDIKSKMAYTYQTQQLIFHEKNPHKDIETLKWDYFTFCRSDIANLQGFLESVRGLLSTLNPEDKEGHAAFKASDYGLTPEDKKLRDELMKRNLNVE